MYQFVSRSSEDGARGQNRGVPKLYQRTAKLGGGVPNCIKELLNGLGVLHKSYNPNESIIQWPHRISMTDEIPKRTRWEEVRGDMKKLFQT